MIIEERDSTCFVKSSQIQFSYGESIGKGNAWGEGGDCENSFTGAFSNGTGGEGSHVNFHVRMSGNDIICEFGHGWGDGSGTENGFGK